MKFSIIVVNYNAGPRIARCMAALAAQSFRDFEVLMIDNASNDGSQKTPVPDERFRWILSDKNLGFAAGNNVGARSAKGEWLFLINPDAYAEEDCLAKLHSATIRHPHDVLFGCTQINDKAPQVLDGMGDGYFFLGFPWRGGEGWPTEELPDEGEVFGPCGAAYMVRKDIFDAHGGFDEDFFCYCEDIDLNFRLRLSGHRAIQVVEAMVRHEGSAITGKRSDFQIFHGTRNRLWCYMKNMPALLCWPLLPFHLLITCLLLLNPAHFKARLAGLLAAFKGLPMVWKKREAIQKNRKAPFLQILKALSWNPWSYFWRKAEVRVIVK